MAASQPVDDLGLFDSIPGNLNMNITDVSQLQAFDVAVDEKATEKVNARQTREVQEDLSNGVSAMEMVKAMLPIKKDSQEEKMALIALMMVRKVKKQMRSTAKQRSKKNARKIQINTKPSCVKSLNKSMSGNPLDMDDGISPTSVMGIF